MEYEKSCGAVIFYIKDGRPVFLLLRHLLGGHWGFSKGHIEEGESEKDAAMREIFEETGLPVTFIPGFRKVTMYSPRSGVTKTVVYFLAKSEKMDVICQPEEIIQYKWQSYSKTAFTLRHESDRSILRSASNFLKRIEIRKERMK